MKKTIGFDKLFNTAVEITKEVCLKDELSFFEGIVLILTDGTTCYYDVEEGTLVKYNNFDEFLQEGLYTENELIVPDDKYDKTIINIINTIFEENMNYNLKEIYLVDRLFS